MTHFSTRVSVVLAILRCELFPVSLLNFCLAVSSSTGLFCEMVCFPWRVLVDRGLNTASDAAGEYSMLVRSPVLLRCGVPGVDPVDAALPGASPSSETSALGTGGRDSSERRLRRVDEADASGMLDRSVARG